MTTWFYKSIGISPHISSKLSEAQLLWARPGVLIMGLILLVPIGVFIYLRQRRNLPQVSAGFRAALTACRVGVILILVIVLAGPYLRLEEKFERKPVLSFIVDESASMTLPAGPFEDDEAAKLAQAAGFSADPAHAKPGEKPVDKKPDKGAPPAPVPAAPAPPATPSPTPAADKSKEKDKDKAGKPDKPAPPPPLTPEVRKKLNTISRNDLVQAILGQRKDDLLKTLGEKYDVRGYRAARSVRTIGPGDLQAAKTPLPPSELEETNLGDAMTRAMDDAAGRQLSGIVVISDGRWTTGPDPMEIMRRVSQTSGKEESTAAVPVWTVPAGSAKPYVDVSVADVLAPAHVAKDDTISVVAAIDSNGMDGRTVNVKLLGPDNKALDTRPLTLMAAERQQVQLTYKADAPGMNVLSVVVDEQPEEQVKQNNKLTAMIEVDTERLKMLYLEGSPRWDFRFLDHSFRRDNGLDVTIVMESQLLAKGVAPADMPKAAKLPQDAAGWGEYAIVMIGDVSPALLPAAMQEQLAKAVNEDGVGVIVLSGQVNMPAMFFGSRLAQLMPVRVEPPSNSRNSGAGAISLATAAGNAPGTGARVAGTADAPLRLTGIESPAFPPFRMKVTAPGAIHPAFRLYDNATQSRAVWSRMPEFYWTAAVAEAGGATTVLAKIESPGPGENRPIFAEHFAGRGRVLFVGTDSTYRWRKNIGSHLFYRFWGQAIRHVAKDKNKAGDKSWIEVNPTRVEPGEAVTIEIYAVDREGQPVSASDVNVQVTGTDSADQVSLSRTNQPGMYRGQWTAKGVGQFKLNYTDAASKTVSAAVQVAGSGREMRRPVVDHESLGMLADATGGALLELDELPRIAELVKGDTKSVVQPHESEIWDNWLTLVLLVSIYCIDLFLRWLLGLM